MLINYNRFAPTFGNQIGYDYVGDEIECIIDFLDETIGEENYRYTLMRHIHYMIIDVADEDCCNMLKFHIALNANTNNIFEL